MIIPKNNFLAAVFAAFTLVGCAASTQRVNRRAESHVKYYAAKQLKCDENEVKATCMHAFSTGECLSYQVVGCNAGIVYSNLTGEGWNP